MSKTTIVFYHIINDKEDKNSQNVFYISKPLNSITLNDIKNEFPLVGTYHFRFKILLNNTHVWVDINDDASSIPSLNSCIYAKVLRLSWLDHKSEKKSINEKFFNDKQKENIYKNDKIIYEEKEKSSNNNIEVHKSKNNIDMLLFETTPNKPNSHNLNKRNVPPKERKTKEQIAAAAAASGRTKKKKWGKGKNKEKLNHSVFIDKSLYSKILDCKNMKVITPSTISEKYKVNLSVARAVIKYLSEKNLINEVCTQSHSQKLYTKIA